MTAMRNTIDPNAIRQIGRYPVRRYLASGGMSWVFEVEDGVLGVSRALKLLKPEAAEGEELTRFANEAKIIARFHHPNLFTVYDFGKDDATGCFYYTMNLVEGVTFAELEVGSAAGSDATRVAGTACTVAEACAFFVHVLDALARLHAEGIIHRDIKPRNIFLQRDRFGETRPMLGDLGVARIEGAKSEVTRAGYTVGTPLYMSPEQVRGSAVGPASDVFSFGLTMYRVLAGHTVYDDVADVDPANASHVLSYLGGLLLNRREFDFKFPASVPEPLRRVIRRACRMQSKERYADASALRKALEEVRSEIAAMGGSRSPRRARAALTAAAGAAALLAAAGGAYWVWSARGDGAGSVADAAARTAALRPLRTDAAALVERLERAADRPDDLAPHAREALSLADQGLAEAERAYAAGDLAEGDAAGKRAGVAYDALCARIARGWLAPEAAAVATRVRDARARLASAPASAQERVRALDRDAEALAAPGEVADCAGARAVAASLDRGRALEGDVAKLDAEVAAAAADAAAAAQARREAEARKRAETKAAVASKDAKPAAPAATTAPAPPPDEPKVAVLTPPTAAPTEEAAVRSAITRWCSAANRGDVLEMEKRAQMTDDLRAAFDKRTVGFDEQRCRIRSLEADGSAYVASVPIEQIQRDGAMSNVMRHFIATVRIAREGDGWRIESIEGAPR